MAPPDKANLRRVIRARRLTISATAARRAANQAIHRLWDLPVMARAARIAVYLPMRGELDCTAVATQAWARGRSVFLPVVTRDLLRFAAFAPDTDLVLNRFGIPEPVAAPQTWRTARELDVIVAPLVAFDVRGRRLGMGGGYYDRTLAFLRQRQQARRPHFIGLAYELQKLATLPTAAWDVQLDAVLTESATYRFT